MRSEKMTVYISPKKLSKVKKYCAQTHESLSQFVNNLIDSYFDTETYWEIMLTRLDNHKEEIHSLKKDLIFIRESFLFFIKYFFANMQDFNSVELKEKAEKKSKKGFKQFVNAMNDILEKVKTIGYTQFYDVD